MYKSIKYRLQQELEKIQANGRFKKENVIISPQDAKVQVSGNSNLINLCANNYLGLANHPKLIQAAQNQISTHGLGLASVRFICGTQDIHKKLEQKIADFIGTEDAILYAAAFDANGGLFEPLFGPEDAIISDELNHASCMTLIRHDHSIILFC